MAIELVDDGGFEQFLTAEYWLLRDRQRAKNAGFEYNPNPQFVCQA